MSSSGMLNCESLMLCYFAMKAVGVEYKIRNEGVNRENVQGKKITVGLQCQLILRAKDRKGAQRHLCSRKTGFINLME